MTLTVLIPFRAPRESHRAALARRTTQLWAAVPDVHVMHASDRGEGGVERGVPWCYSAGANRARAAARDFWGDDVTQILLYGADHIPPTPDELQRIRDGLEQHPWIAVYDKTREYSERETERIVAGADPGSIEPGGRKVKVCVPILAMWANVFDSLGGMDMRFRGWGWEDAAFRLALNTIYPEGNDVGEGRLRALWHQRAPRRHLSANLDRYDRYVRAAERGPAALLAHLREPGGPLAELEISLTKQQKLEVGVRS